LPDYKTCLNQRINYIILIFAVCFFSSARLYAQYKIKGTVYDSSRLYGMPYVTVQSTGGKIALSNQDGDYEINVGENDSIWFSYLNKPTVKYPVLSIKTPLQFDISLRVPVDVLKEVKVRSRNYKQDSIQNRIDYAKAFNWEKPKIRAALGSGPGAAVGFDLDEIIRLFQFRKNKSWATFQKRLEEEEREKFVDYRFNKGLVLRLTGLNGTARDSFMIRCRPSFQYCMMTNDYEFQLFIKNCYEEYKLEKLSGDLKPEERKTFLP
jgi:hypothetical protein